MQGVDRPVVLPLSNPTSNCEAAPADIYSWTGGRALVATGSPFADVAFAGRSFRVGQGNNAYIFPGVGLAALAAGMPVINNRMFFAAATALAACVTDHELQSGLLYPAVPRMREVARAVAAAVIADWQRETGGTGPTADPAQLATDTMWSAEYESYVPG